MVLDAHNDTIVSLIRRGNLSLSGAEAPHLEHLSGTVRALRGDYPEWELAFRCQVDLPKLRAGGIGAAFFAVDVTLALKNHLAYAMDAFGYFHADLAVLSDEIVLARTADDIRAAHAAGKIAAVLVIENSDALEGSLNILRSFHSVGVRSIVLTHNPTALAAAGNAESASGGGLTRFGRSLVAEMNRLGMIVDVSHIAERGFFDTLEVTTRPVIASHSCCMALCQHPRNLTDTQLRALAQNGGVIGITFVAMFLDAEWTHDGPQPTVERVLDHIEHAVEVAGIDHVGIGSDFDGGGTALRDAAEYPAIGEGMQRRGFGEEEIRKILGENFLRVIEKSAG